jgi:hypothetical protein
MERIAPVAEREGWHPDEAEAAAIQAFVDPGLRHHRAASLELAEPLAGIVAKVDAGLRALIVRDDLAARERLDQAYAELDGKPWLEGDIVHDELRHRRVPAGSSEPEPELEPALPPEPTPIVREALPEPAPDPSGDAALIRGSGLFDVDYYLSRYPDVRDSGLDPVDHYLQIGAAKGYHPSPLFDTGYYARQMARRLGAVGGR